MSHDLETPPSADAVFLSTEWDEEFDARPLMTGDVLELPGEKRVTLVQHPCAMRAGAALLPRLLACEVDTAAIELRSKWHKERYSRMRLEALGESTVVDFTRPVVIDAAEAHDSRRVAIMDRLGVNLLLQRWVHHNSRVVIKTVTYDEQSTGPYAEVEIVHQAVSDLLEGGFSREDAETAIESFLANEVSDVRGDTWRARIREPQQQAPARRAADALVRELLVCHGQRSSSTAEGGAEAR